MSANIPIPFAIGVPIWHARLESHETSDPCPECLGTLAVIVVTAGGTEHLVPCAGCGPWGPTGRITRQTFTVSPRRFVPGRVSIRGDEITYSESGPDATCYSSVYVRDLFASREEAEARCAEIKAEREREAEEREARNIVNNREMAVRSVSHWRVAVTRLRKQLAIAEGRVDVLGKRKPVHADTVEGR